MIICDGMEFEVGEQLICGGAVGITDNKLVRRTRDHALAGYAGEDIKPGCRAGLSGGSFYEVVSLTPDEERCETCGRHIMALPRPASGYLAKCGRRLTRLDECGHAEACEQAARAAYYMADYVSRPDTKRG